MDHVVSISPVIVLKNREKGNKPCKGEGDPLRDFFLYKTFALFTNGMVKEGIKYPLSAAAWPGSPTRKHFLSHAENENNSFQILAERQKYLKYEILVLALKMKSKSFETDILNLKLK